MFILVFLEVGIYYNFKLKGRNFNDWEMIDEIININNRGVMWKNKS